MAGPTSLCQAFPKVYAIALRKFGSVEDHMVRSNQPVAWNLHLRREINDWEILPISCLMIRIENARVGEMSDADQQVWLCGTHAGFTVRSMYNLIRQNGAIEEPSVNI